MMLDLMMHDHLGSRGANAAGGSSFEMQSDTFADAMETNVLSAERAAAGRFAWLNNQG